MAEKHEKVLNDEKTKRKKLKVLRTKKTKKKTKKWKFKSRAGFRYAVNILKLGKIIRKK